MGSSTSKPDTPLISNNKVGNANDVYKQGSNATINPIVTNSVTNPIVTKNSTKPVINSNIPLKVVHKLPPPIPAPIVAKPTVKKSWFAKKDLNTEFTTDYGLSVNMISFICAVYSRLAYMNDHQFLGHYTKIFGSIIPDEMMIAINAQVMASKDARVLLNDTEI